MAIFSPFIYAQGGFPLTNPTSLANGSYVVVNVAGGNTTGVAIDSLLGAAGAAPGIDSTTYSNDSAYVWSGGTDYFTGITDAPNDGNGIYGGSGTVPDGTEIGITDFVYFDSSTFVLDAQNKRVGIGTTTPSYSLDLDVTTTNKAARIIQRGPGGALTVSSTNSTGDLAHFTSWSNTGTVQTLSGPYLTTGNLIYGTLPFFNFTGNIMTFREEGGPSRELFTVTSKGGLRVGGTGGAINSIGSQLILQESAGSVRFGTYGAGNREAADLSKTESDYIACYATDGTLLEKPISELASGYTPNDGIFTPTVTNNVITTDTIIGSDESHYSVGDSIVSGILSFEVAVTNATTHIYEIDLPVASDLTNSKDAKGMAIAAQKLVNLKTDGFDKIEVIALSSDKIRLTAYRPIATLNYPENRFKITLNYSYLLK